MDEQLENPNNPKQHAASCNLEAKMDAMKNQMDEMMKLLKEVLKMKEKVDEMPVQVSSMFHIPNELSLAPEIVLPKDIKMLEFTKYNGTTSPRIHLQAYCTKMALWSRDEKLFLHMFPESLIGPAADWYWRLDRSKIQTWTQLAEAFMAYYAFNDTMPNRLQLKTMKKKDSESFREYVQRWRHFAVQVHPPLEDEEMIDYFQRTLQSPFAELMMANIYYSFSDLLEVGERIEALKKEGRLSGARDDHENNKARRSPQTKKKGKVRYVDTPPPQKYQSYPNTTYYLQPSYSQSQYQHIPEKYYPSNKPTYTYIEEPFPNISISRDELFKQLINAHLITLVLPRPMEPPFPQWYNPNLTCVYHLGEVGHSIDTCLGFQRDLLRLIRTGVIKVEETEGIPTVNINPVPKHKACPKFNLLVRKENK